MNKTNKLINNARMYASKYGQTPYGEEIEGTAELLLQMADRIEKYEKYEEIFRSKMTDATCDLLKDKEEFTRWLDRNKWIAKKCDEYARLEEQGKLLKLPCAVGDRVFALIFIGYYQEHRIVKCDVIKRIYIDRKNIIMLEFEYIVPDTELSNIGKIVFFTREEAEAALSKVDK